MLASHAVLLLAAALQAQAATDDEDPHPHSAAFFSRPRTPSPAPEIVRHAAIYYVSGLGAPLGIAGVEGVDRYGSIFEISAGVGVGLGALSAQPHAGIGQVLQWSVMPRLRLGDDRGGITFGAGFSGGNYGAGSFCADGPCSSTTTELVSYFLWSNLEIGLEHWWDSGFGFRLFGGFAHGWCVSSTCVSAPRDLPYLGFAVGYAFE